ncbi:MAG: hypothetical protein AAGA42_02640 [Actinomycetota bacterium]
MSDAIAEAAARRWDELLAIHPETRRALADGQQQAGLTAHGHALCSVARPAFISSAEFERQRSAVADVVGALRRARDVVVAHPERETLLGQFASWIDELTALEVPDVDHGDAIRLDGFGVHHLHFVEANADLPGGAGHADALAELFETTPVWPTFAEEFQPHIVRMLPPMIATLVSSWQRWGRGDGDGPQLAIVSWSGRNEVTDATVDSTLRAALSSGIDAWHAEPAELEWRADRLYADGRPCDLVFRAMLTPWVLDGLDELAPLIAALRDDAVCMVNSFRAELMGNKALFALLTDPSIDLGLTAVQRRAVDEHVPWGRILRDHRTTDPDGGEIDLTSWVETQRAQLVIKPTHEAAGRGVVLGWEVDAAAWREAIEGGLDGDHIVQARVEMPVERFPLIVGGEADLVTDTDPFVFDGQLATFFSRLSGAGITNVSSGASLVPTVIVAS